MISCRSTCLSDTHAIASAISQLIRARDLVVLSGEMGAGKTAFTVGFAAGLGVTDSDHVSSPTFTLVHVYSTGRLELLHADLYRLTTLAEIADLGLREQIDMGAVGIVEWGDVAEGVLGDCLVVEIHNDENEESARDVVVSVVGHGWDTRWEHLKNSLRHWSNS